MKKLALIAALSVVGIANAQAADGTITINGLVTDKTCDIVTPAGKDFTVTLPTVSKTNFSCCWGCCWPYSFPNQLS